MFKNLKTFTILLLGVLASCRGGEFENKRSFSVYDSARIEFLEYTDQGLCPESDESESSICELIEMKFRMWSPSKSKEIRYQSLRLNVRLDEKCLLEWSGQTDREGFFIATVPVRYTRYFSKDTLSLDFEFSTLNFGELHYRAEFNASEKEMLSRWTEEPEQQRSLPNLQGRALSVSGFEAQVVERSKKTAQTQNVDLNLTIHIEDLFSSEPLFPQKIAIKVAELRSNEEYEFEIESNDGFVQVPLRLKYRPHDHEYLQRVDLRLEALSEPARSPLYLVAILNLGKANAIENLWLAEEIDESHPWYRRSFLSASQESQEIQLQDPWVQYFPDAKPPQFNIQFQAFLERENFEAENTIDLRKFKTLVEVQAVCSQERPCPTVSRLFEAAPNTKYFHLVYPHEKLHLLNDSPLPRFKIKIELLELLQIAPQTFEINTSGQIIKRDETP